MTREIKYLPLQSLVSNPDNPKDHDIGMIVESIERFGFNDAVIVDGRTGMLVGGHGRVEALRAMWKTGVAAPAGIVMPAADQPLDWLVPVQVGWSSKDDAEAMAFIIAINRAPERGGWNEPKLEEVLVALGKMGTEALIGTGYDNDDIHRLLNASTAAALGASDPDEIPDPKEIWVQPGQMYQLGDHRIICGDSTDVKVALRLIEDAKPVCCWTDPPYGVEYEGKAGSIMNDGAEGLPKLLAGAFATMFKVLEPGSFIYVAHPAGKQASVFTEEITRARFEHRQGLVWCKDRFALGYSDYHYRHEPIIYALKPVKGAGRRGRGGKGWYGDDSQTSVLEFPMPTKSEEHPTMKPIELVEACLKNSTAPGHVVFEPFSGSGTTLLACERLQRRCFAIELDPRYVQVAIERWEKFTQKKAVELVPQK